MSITTEIVTLKTVSNIMNDVFVRIVEALEKDFHLRQDGFIDTELLYDEENDSWTMVQHWQSTEQLKAASEKMFQDERAATFVNALEPASVKMTILPQIKVWHTT